MPPTEPFSGRHTAPDVQLLVDMDRANEDICGSEKQNAHPSFEGLVQNSPPPV